jgi:hypothetical protein
VRAIWTGIRRVPREVQYFLELAERHVSVAKAEALVRDEDGERVMGLVRAAAHTGPPGDGVVYALPVCDTVHVRTGARGGAALAQRAEPSLCALQPQRSSAACRCSAGRQSARRRRDRT